jgi:hypothetical protein
MRKVAAYILLFLMIGISMLPKAAVQELHKSHTLLAHLNQHVEEGDSANWLEAFRNHYSFQCDHHDPAHQEELPFLSGVQQGSVFLSQKHIQIVLPLSLKGMESHFLYSCLLTSIYLESLKEPPSILA